MRGLRRIQAVFSGAVLSSMAACQLLTGTSDLHFDGKTGGAGGSGGKPDCMTCYAQARDVIGVADPTTVEWCSGPDGIDQKRYSGVVSCMQAHPICIVLCNGTEPANAFPRGENCLGCLKESCSDALVACLLAGGCVTCSVAFELNLDRNNETAQWCEGSQAIYKNFVDQCRCEPYNAADPASGGCNERCRPAFSTCGMGPPSDECQACFLNVACAEACTGDLLP